MYQLDIFFNVRLRGILFSFGFKEDFLIT